MQIAEPVTITPVHVLASDLHGDGEAGWGSPTSQEPVTPRFGRSRAAAEQLSLQSPIADELISVKITNDGAILSVPQEGASGSSGQGGASGPATVLDSALTDVVRGCDGRSASEGRAMQLWDAKIELTDVHVEWMLEPWVGNKNYERKRVTPLGPSFVRSDTVWARDYPPGHATC